MSATASSASAVSRRAVGPRRTSSRRRRGDAAIAAPPSAKGQIVSAGTSQSQSIPACSAHISDRREHHAVQRPGGRMAVHPAQHRDQDREDRCGYKGQADPSQLPEHLHVERVSIHHIEGRRAVPRPQQLVGPRAAASHRVRGQGVERHVPVVEPAVVGRVREPCPPVVLPARACSPPRGSGRTVVRRSRAPRGRARRSRPGARARSRPRPARAGARAPAGSAPRPSRRAARAAPLRTAAAATHRATTRATSCPCATAAELVGSDEASSSAP